MPFHSALLTWNGKGMDPQGSEAKRKISTPGVQSTLVHRCVQSLLSNGGSKG